jgi:hypothetical protein
MALVYFAHSHCSGVDDPKAETVAKADVQTAQNEHERPEQKGGLRKRNVRQNIPEVDAAAKPETYRASLKSEEKLSEKQGGEGKREDLVQERSGEGSRKSPAERSEIVQNKTAKRQEGRQEKPDNGGGNRAMNAKEMMNAVLVEDGSGSNDDDDDDDDEDGESSESEEDSPFDILLRRAQEDRLRERIDLTRFFDALQSEKVDEAEKVIAMRELRELLKFCKSERMRKYSKISEFCMGVVSLGGMGLVEAQMKSQVREVKRTATKLHEELEGIFMLNEFV